MNLTLSDNPNTQLKGYLKYRNFTVEIVLLAIFSALLVWFLILPKTSEIRGKEEELQKLQKEEAAIGGKLDKLRELAGTLRKSQQEVALLDQSLPLDGKVLRLHFLINELADQAGVTLGNISVATPSTAPVAGDKALLNEPFKAKRQLQKLSGSIYVIGKFGQLRAFMKKIENSGRLIDVTSVSIDPTQGDDLNLRLIFTAYYYGP